MIVSGFDGDTGDFTVQVRPITSPSKVTTDFNLLFFGPDGTYYGALADANRLTGRPLEITSLAGLPEVQIVISRSGTGPLKPTTLRYVLNDGIYVSEYFDSLAPAIFGHPTAKGATAVAAYDPFQPYLPEGFTSPGGDLKISFDSAGNRFATPEVRRVPQIASTDGGNTTFFVSDSTSDPDTQPNFFGTSASAPHAAAIAALLLDRSAAPARSRPTGCASGSWPRPSPTTSTRTARAGERKGLTITAVGPQGDERDADPGAMADPRFFSLALQAQGRASFGHLLRRDREPDRAHHRGQGWHRVRPAPAGYGALPRRRVPVHRRCDLGRSPSQARGGRVHAARGHGPVPAHDDHVHQAWSQEGRRPDFSINRDLAVPAAGIGPYEGNGADTLGGATFIPKNPRSPAACVSSPPGSTVAPSPV